MSCVERYDWKEYKEVIVHIDISNKGLKKTMQLNMPILNTMDRTVKLYEQMAQ